MKKSLLVIIVFILVGVGVYLLVPSDQGGVELVGAKSYKDATYIIEGKSVTLANGVRVAEAAPGSASKITTRYFGNEVVHDFDADGRDDVAFLLTQEGGGSGTFYYVVAALNTEGGYKGSSSFLLGDRIAPQTTEMSRDPSRPNVIIVNYADRKPGEDFSIRPSVGKSVWLLLDPGTMQLGTVEQDFAGEADPSRMTLGMKTWVWQFAQYNDGRVVRPKQTGKFTLTFANTGSFSATTDCNQMGGKYTASKSTLAFSSIFSTKMYCEGSQESEFQKLLENAAGYHFTSKGELVLDLKFDSGTAVFR